MGLCSHRDANGGGVCSLSPLNSGALCHADAHSPEKKLAAQCRHLQPADNLSRCLSPASKAPAPGLVHRPRERLLLSLTVESRVRVRVGGGWLPKGGRWPHPIPARGEKKKPQALASALAVWYGAVRRCVFGKAKVKTKPGISQEGNGVVYVASRQILALSAQRRRHPSTELVAKPKPCLCPFSTVPLMAWQNVPEGPVSHFTLCSLWFCTECQRARCHL